MNSKELKLLEKWLYDNSFINWANNSDNADISKWDEFFRTNLHLLETGEIGKQIVKGIPFVPINVDEQRKEDSFVSFQKKLTLLEQKHQPNHKLKRIIQFAITSAAIILLFLSVYTQTDYHNQTLFSTHYGEMASYVLPDNSKVTLNANSSLKYDKRYPREVWIDGEAFFEIVKKPKTGTNFKVHSEDATITVLGTSFNVNSRNKKTKVYLKEGKIKLALKGSNDNDIIEMRPGDAVSYSEEKREIITKDNLKNIKQTVSWLDGSLTFKNESIITVFNKMEEIYGVSFIVKSENLINKRITIGIPINNLNIALEAIKTSLNASLTRDGNNLIIKEKQELRLTN